MTAQSAARAADPDHESDAHALLNTLLDLCERNVEAVIAAGGEAPLRARLDRLLPAPVPSAPPATPALARNMARALNLLQVDAALEWLHKALAGGNLKFLQTAHKALARADDPRIRAMAELYQQRATS